MIITLKRKRSITIPILWWSWKITFELEDEVYIPDEKESKPAPKPVEKPPKKKKKKKKPKKKNTDNDHLDGMHKNLDRLENAPQPDYKPVHNLKDDES